MRDSFEEIRVPPVVAPPVLRGPGIGDGQAAVQVSKRLVVAVVVGGWLKDQTARTLQPALRAAGIRTVSPAGLDDWRAPIAGLAKGAMREAGASGEVALALIGHSFGGQAVCDAVGELAREGIFPAFVGLIDPVLTKPGIPRPIVLDTAFQKRGGALHVYYRTFLLGPIRANLVDERGGMLATLHEGCRRIGGTHNSICHCGEVVEGLVEVVRGLG